GLAGYLAKEGIGLTGAVTPKAAAPPPKKTNGARTNGSPPPRPAPSPVTPRGGVDLSLIYFASGTSGPDDDKYMQVKESAIIADEAGFSAMWVRERLLFESGALYPGPWVRAGGLATIPRRIRLRAGSVVVPLHHPVHLAERWAMVDNLSGG